MFKLIKKRGKIIIIIILIISVILGVMIFTIFQLKNNTEREFNNKANIVVVEKWDNLSKLLEDKSLKNKFVYNYYDLSKPKLYIVYTVGYNKFSDADTTLFIKYNLKYENFKLVQDGGTVEYSIISGDKFENIIKNLEIKSFEEIKKLNNGKYISNGTPEPTTEELEKRNQQKSQDIIETKNKIESYTRQSKRSAEERIQDVKSNILLFKECETLGFDFNINKIENRDDREMLLAKGVELYTKEQEKCVDIGADSIKEFEDYIKKIEKEKETGINEDVEYYKNKLKELEGN